MSSYQNAHVFSVVAIKKERVYGTLPLLYKVWEGANPPQKSLFLLHFSASQNEEEKPGSGATLPIPVQQGDWVTQSSKKLFFFLIFTPLPQKSGRKMGSGALPYAPRRY
ncbi:MAG: hypothetical protein HC875_25815 [Anaerolineales bacterium]|nr:hypothetical protein [Anaerolineales bacterium]